MKTRRVRSSTATAGGKSGVPPVCTVRRRAPLRASSRLTAPRQNEDPVGGRVNRDIEGKRAEAHGPQEAATRRIKHANSAPARDEDASGLLIHRQALCISIRLAH